MYVDNVVCLNVMTEENTDLIPNLEYDLSEPSLFAIQAIQLLEKANRQIDILTRTLQEAILRAHIVTDNTTINRGEAAIAGGSLYVSVLKRHGSEIPPVTQKEIAHATGCAPVTVRHVYDDIQEETGDNLPRLTQEYIGILVQHKSLDFTETQLTTFS